MDLPTSQIDYPQIIFRGKYPRPENHNFVAEMLSVHQGTRKRISSSKISNTSQESKVAVQWLGSRSEPLRKPTPVYSSQTLFSKWSNSCNVVVN